MHSIELSIDEIVVIIEALESKFWMLHEFGGYEQATKVNSINVRFRTILFNDAQKEHDNENKGTLG